MSDWRHFDDLEFTPNTGISGFLGLPGSGFFPQQLHRKEGAGWFGVPAQSTSDRSDVIRMTLQKMERKTKQIKTAPPN